MEVNPIELQKYLKGTDYPAKKDDLVSTAQGNGAPSEVTDQLQGLGEQEFSGPDQVMKALKQS